MVCMGTTSNPIFSQGRCGTTKRREKEIRHPPLSSHPSKFKSKSNEKKKKKSKSSQVNPTQPNNPAQPDLT